MAKSTCSSASSASSTSSPLSPYPASTSSSSDTGHTNTKLHPSSADRRKRLAANARERKRMHLLNKAYDGLRRKLTDAQTKSKYDVLVQAKEYIQALASILEHQQEHRLHGSRGRASEHSALPAG